MKKKFSYFISFFISIIIIFTFIYFFYNIKFPINYVGYINKYSTRYNLEPEIVASLINAESSYIATSVSSSGAVGLMQILPSTAEYISELIKEEFDLKKLYEPETNIKYGCFYLNYLYKKFTFDKEVLSAYNAGETIVFSWLKDVNLSKNGKTLDKIPYQVTNSYVNKILNTKKYYLGRV